MKETIFVQFAVQGMDQGLLEDKLLILGDDFQFIDRYFVRRDYGATEPIMIITGKMDAMLASVLKMQDPFLAVTGPA